MTLLEIEGLVVAFGEVAAVDGVSLQVEPGELVGLLGANGAGKTTLIRTALGLQRATSGRVALLGGPPSRRARREVGYVPQSLGLWQDLTAAQNLEFVAAAYGAPVPTLPAGLERIGDEAVADLSLGHRRRVAFEAALSHHPRLLVLDEPTSGVGALERTRLWDRIHAAREREAGVLVTTHHMSEAEQCDRAVVLLGGRVVLTGTVDSLLAGRRTAVVTAEDWQEAFARLDAAFPAVALAGRAVRVPGAEVDEVTAALGDLRAHVGTEPASFDEVFVSLGAPA